MTKRRLYLVLQTVLCIALTALLSASAIGIYREGSLRKAEHPMEPIYTPEVVAERFAPIAPLFFVGVGLLIAGLVLSAKDEHAEKPVRDAEIMRELLVSRVAQPTEAMRSERRAQRRLAWIGRGLFALCMVPIVAYLLNPEHFPEADLEGMFFGLLRVLLPWTVVGLGALAVTSALRERSALREVQAAQARLKEERASGAAAVCGPVGRPKSTAAVQAVIVVVAVVLIIAGVFNGGARDVLYKAIAICTECVGLG